MLKILDSPDQILCIVTETSRYELGVLIKESIFGQVVYGTLLINAQEEEGMYLRSPDIYAIKKYSKEKMRNFQGQHISNL
jgi:hypothetical protein